MSTQDPNSNEAMSWEDVEFIYYRHRKLIRWCTLLGLLGALLFFLAWPLPYESQSKLLVRYVLDRSMVDPQESKTRVPDATYNESLIAAEKEILASNDLSLQTAGELMKEPILQGSTLDLEHLAKQIASGLTITGSKGSNVITVAYKDAAPGVAQRTLEILINKYFTKHLEVHRSANAFEYVSRETSQVQSRLKAIEEELKRARATTGIISLKESEGNLELQLAKSRDAVNSAEQELASQQARVKELEKLLGSLVPVSQGAALTPAASRKEIRTYQTLSFGVATLRQKQLDLLTRYTPESQIARATREQIGVLESQQNDLEKRYPALLQMAPEKPGNFGVGPRDPQLDLISERATLAALEEKAGILRSQLSSILQQAKTFAEIAPLINSLEQQKELESTNFKYFQESLDKARIDEALDPSKIPNISIVQKPTKAEKAAGKRSKILLGISLGGMLLGVGISALKETVFDRTVKRPADLSGKGLLLSIPRFSENKSMRESQLYEYAHALRERLELDLHGQAGVGAPGAFAAAGSTRIVGCTACGYGAGTTTISEALARVLSKYASVLMVSAQCSSAKTSDTELLRQIPGASANRPPRGLTTASLNLGSSFSAWEEVTDVREVASCMRTSGFDYIILDLPPLGSTSPATSLASYLDKLLVVVEAEVNRKTVVECRLKELEDLKANTALILNKFTNYGPECIRTKS